MRIAYFTNIYPKTSHSFIRREIAHLELQGFEVDRLALRRSDDPLVTEADEKEQSRTLHLLDGSKLMLLRFVSYGFLSNPIGFLKAFSKLAFRKENSLVLLLKCFAYALEAPH